MVKKTIVSPFICMQKAIQIMRQQRHIHANHKMVKKTIISPLICMQMGKEILRQQRHLHGRQQRQIQARSNVLGVLIRPGPE